MARYPLWTNTEESELKSYLKDGFSYDEIAELMGRTKISVSNYAKRRGWGIRQNKQKFPADVQKKIDAIKEQPSVSDSTSDSSKPKQWNTFTPSAPVKEKTLKDFPPRDMIKYLYDMGYRIEDNKLVCLVKQVVNLKDIINA